MGLKRCLCRTRVSFYDITTGMGTVFGGCHLSRRPYFLLDLVGKLVVFWLYSSSLLPYPKFINVPTRLGRHN